MPRSPEGVYTKPPGTNGGPPNTPISSTAYNNLMNDIAQDLNTPRPVVAGGTGGNNAIGGLDGLHTASVPIPASATTDLAGATGVSVLITGNSDIEEFGTVHAGATRVLTFEEALTLIYDADDTKIILPRGENYTVAAGEVITMMSEGDGVWRLVSSSSGSGAKSRFLANKNGVNQAIPDAATIITFGNEVFDEGGIYDHTTSTFTPPVGKVYLVHAQIVMPMDGADRGIECRILRDGSLFAKGFDSGGGDDNLTAGPQVTIPIVGDGAAYTVQISRPIAISYSVSGAVTDTFFWALEQ